MWWALNKYYFCCDRYFIINPLYFLSWLLNLSCLNAFLSHWLLSHESLLPQKRSLLTSYHSQTSVLHPEPPQCNSQRCLHTRSISSPLLHCSTHTNLFSTLVAPQKQLPWDHQWLLLLYSTDIFSPLHTGSIRSTWFFPPSWKVLFSFPLVSVTWKPSQSSFYLSGCGFPTLSQIHSTQH